MLSMSEEFSCYDFTRAEEYLKKKSCPENSVGWAAAVNAIIIGVSEFKPTRDAGQGMIAVPVHDDNGDFTNIVAFDPHKPSQWYLRSLLGRPPVLGLDQLYSAITFRTKIVVHETPLQWMMADSFGCCPLTEDSYERFMGLTEMKCAPRLYKKIIDRLHLRWSMPKNEI
jgi:hypothetical protein